MKSLYNKAVAESAILYLLEKTETCDARKLYLMIFFADQYSLVNFGRAITYDTYIATHFGPQPININNLLFSYKQGPNMDFLSASDTESLDYAYNNCEHLQIEELISKSKGYAWKRTKIGNIISVEDIMMEKGCNEEYIKYVTDLNSISENLL